MTDARIFAALSRHGDTPQRYDARGLTWQATLWLVEVFVDGSRASRLVVDATTAKAASDAAFAEERERWAGDIPKIEAFTIGWFRFSPDSQVGTLDTKAPTKKAAAAPTKARATSRKASKAGTYYTTPDGVRHGPLVLESAEKALRELREWVHGLEEGRAGRVLAHEMGQDHVNELVRINRKEIKRMVGVVEAIRAGVPELPRDLVPPWSKP